LLLPLIDGPHRLLDAARAARESEALDTPLPDDVHRALGVGQSDKPGEGWNQLGVKGLLDTWRPLTSKPSSSKIPKPRPRPSASPKELPPPDEDLADPAAAAADDAEAAARLAAIELPGTLLGPSLAVVETEMEV
jgi:hypothetical protein